MSNHSHSNHLVSVVIPVRNGKEFIFEAIQSVLGQSFSDLEVIVVDDGSDDYDYQSLDKIDSRIRVIRLPGCGVSVARNTGMASARGRYIAFLDADDAWFPGKLEAQVRYFSLHPDVGCVFGGFIKWHQDSLGCFPPAEQLSSDCSSVTKFDAARSGWVYTRLLTGLLVGMNTAVIRREVYELLGGFDESMRIGEDYMFWLKVSRIFEMHALDAPVALYRIHPSSAMSRLDSVNHQTRFLAIAFHRWGLMNPDGTCLTRAVFEKQLALSEFTHGYNHYWNGDPMVAARAFKRAFRGGALRLRSGAYFLLSGFKAFKKKLFAG